MHSISEINALKKCSHLHFLNQLKITSFRLERSNFFKKVFEIICMELLNQSTVKITEEHCKQYFNINYKRDWYNSTLQYNINKTRDYERIKRLIKYLFSMDISVIDTGISYICLLEEPVNIENKIITKIKGYCNLIIQHKDGSFEAIKFLEHSPRFSYYARKENRKIANSIELLTMKIALKAQYKNLKVSLYHLRGKEDKKGNLQVFEQKRGYNIITNDFLSNEGNLQNKLQHSLLLKEEKDCDTCYANKYCRIKPSLSLQQFPPKQSEHSNTPQKTSSQNEVIHFKEGAMSVIAVPGAGKTFTLIERVKNLIKSGINPQNILLITFTKKACNELIKRLGELEIEDSRFPNVYTFNSLGYHILQENSSFCGNLKLASKVDKSSLLLSVLCYTPKIRNISYDVLTGKYGLISRLLKWFEEIKIGENEFSERYHDKLDTKTIIYIYTIYQKQLRNEGYIDYDDQILLVNKLFNTYPELSKKYSSIYQYIMIDEYQDVNAHQVDMIKHIVQHHNNLVVVGDDDQCIYKFRGADCHYMLNFNEMFPHSKQIFMCDNFRSNDKILKVSNLVIENFNNQERFKKKLIPHILANKKPLFLRDCNKEILLKYLQELLKKYQPGNIAILAKNNNILFKLFDYLTKHHIPASVPKDYIIDEPIFLLLYNILELYYTGIENDASFINLVIQYGIEIKKILFNFQKDEESIYKSLVKQHFIMQINLNDDETYKMYQEYYNQGQLDELNEFGYRLFQILKCIKQSEEPNKTLKEIFCIWYKQNFSHPILNVLETSMKDRRINTLKELYFLMKNMILFEDQTRMGYDISLSSINLLTAHDAKGKEFPAVIIYDIQDFNLRHSGDDIRLLYVAMTRAKENLLLMQNIDADQELLHLLNDDITIVDK